MKHDDWENAVNIIKEFGSEMRDDAAIERTITKLVRQLIKKSLKKNKDDILLRHIVFAIELGGMSQNMCFKMMETEGVVTKAYVKLLWKDARSKSREKVEAYRQFHAYRLVSEFIQGFKGVVAKDPAILSFMIYLIKEETALVKWAFEKVRLDSSGEEYEDFKPDYKKSTIDELSKANSAFIGYKRSD